MNGVPALCMLDCSKYISNSNFLLWQFKFLCSRDVIYLVCTWGESAYQVLHLFIIIRRWRHCKYIRPSIPCLQLSTQPKNQRKPCRLMLSPNLEPSDNHRSWMKLMKKQDHRFSFSFPPKWNWNNDPYQHMVLYSLFYMRFKYQNTSSWKSRPGKHIYWYIH